MLGRAKTARVKVLVCDKLIEFFLFVLLSFLFLSVVIKLSPLPKMSELWQKNEENEIS